MKRNTQAFTLIELLVVVGIISILASIAVPNFLEAQTRAKVSRVQSDLRTISIALESYAVDHTSYPICGDLEGNPIPFYPWSGPYILGTRLGVTVTTPIAYLSIRPTDLFSERPEAQLPYFYHTRDYAQAKKDCAGADYLMDYVARIAGTPRTATQYILSSNGPDRDHDLLSDAPG